MAKGTVKRKPTPSSLRKKKAQQRIRKRMKAKLEKKRPSWRAAIAKTYTKASDVAHGKDRGGKKGRHGKSSVKDGEDEKAADVQDEDIPNGGEGEVGDEVEVQSDVDSAKEQRLNERDPLETQLFLKNLPLDTSEEELLRFFSLTFAPVRRVLLVRNRISKMFTGTGFVHCGSAELANRIFEAAQQNAYEVSATQRQDMQKQTEGMSHHQAKRLMFKQRGGTLAARDPFLTMRETKFTVHRVLSRSDTQEAVGAALKKKKRTKVAGEDSRHLYLLQEGLILPDSPAAKGLHPRYLQMIQDDYEARKAQLQNNIYFVSERRLSVRNLPRNLLENDVRRMFAKAAREYLEAHPEHMDRERWGKYGPIKNIKVLRDTAGVSRGFGFVEFVNHPVALHVLRKINNNPTLFKDQRRLMVSFAVENMNAIQKLQRIKEMKHKRASSGGEGGGSGGGGDGSSGAGAKAAPVGDREGGGARKRARKEFTGRSASKSRGSADAVTSSTKKHRRPRAELSSSS